VTIASFILLLLFSVQRVGTHKVGWLFAPVVFIWLISIGGIGIYNIIKHDFTVLKAFSPVYIIRYFSSNAKRRWVSLGGVLLSITGKSFQWKRFKWHFKLFMCFLVPNASRESLRYFTFLCTGTEALYADVGHFSVFSVQVRFTV
jgi:K+ transporter